MVRPYQPFRNTQGRFCMAGYHCLMPNGIFPANPSPMSNGIVSLLTAPCMLPNGIFFLSGCHCLMLIGIFPANLCPMPLASSLLTAQRHPLCWLPLCLLPTASFCFNASGILFFQPCIANVRLDATAFGNRGDEKKPFHGVGDRLLLSELYPCGKALIYLWNTFL